MLREHSPNKRHFAFTESHPKSLITPDLSTTPRRALLHPTLPGNGRTTIRFPARALVQADTVELRSVCASIGGDVRLSGVHGNAGRATAGRGHDRVARPAHRIKAWQAKTGIGRR